MVESVCGNISKISIGFRVLINGQCLGDPSPRWRVSLFFGWVSTKRARPMIAKVLTINQAFWSTSGHYLGDPSHHWRFKVSNSGAFCY